MSFQQKLGRERERQGRGFGQVPGSGWPPGSSGVVPLPPPWGLGVGFLPVLVEESLGAGEGGTFPGILVSRGRGWMSEGGAHKREKGSQGICWRTAAFATVKGGAEDKPARAGGPSEGTARVPREQGCLLVVWSPSTSSLTPLRLSNVCGTNEPVCLPVKPGPLWPTLVVRSLSVSCRLLQMAQSKENAGSAGPGALSGPASLGAPSPSRGASRCPTMPLCLSLASSISLRPWPSVAWL